MSANPILPGFHPDPTICRVEGDYFLATSSFEYFPGVPIHHSTDLVHWEQIGNVLDRPSQLVVTRGEQGASRGIYAPTLRHHDGVFWLVTTNLDEIQRGHLIVHTTDPAGPWSDPVYTQGTIGIDPDLAWDDDGACFLTWKDPLADGIAQVRVDPLTGELLSEHRILTTGTGLAHPEGPHLIRRGEWWYLVTAEGGTHTGHVVSVARSRSIEGPFEQHPGPLLTHRSTSDPVQATGHADMFQLADGSWAMVHLGVRQRGSFPRWHVNGRETFLVGIDWIDDWPVVREDRFEVADREASFEDTFDSATLGPRWIAPGIDPHRFAGLDAAGLTLQPGRAPEETEAVHLVGVRATDAEWQASVAARGDLALVVRIDDAHWVGVQRVGGVLAARAVIGPLQQELESAEVSAEVRLAVRTVLPQTHYGERSGPDRIELGYVADGFHPLASIDGRYVSTEVAGGFTGRIIGIEALGANEAVVTSFRYDA
ncbi:Glycosyl hydrolases family 43 [Leifsonia sp. 98AMF]|uniref:glycoside hydrolase family 43 protein n=1 Tax=unclassified Leifsonia TaxID=2663824 RepID=UPI00087B2081|nr:MULTISPECIES: glycoside hydrolase family 43 protein [unclassified Leifsonia]SDH60568.1 Glycosyl hydrolases family 43 [Leifsonia sp. 197AMF]SDI78545.1 Glycosyl hydrolases family 43 [Leifsonia sp. 466MF]SDK07616.1 Glycosyl hydrolases family 43 [Leifsonia sp. 157MF]SDN82079.1 Glycosyl hydrolases family 43 [Leifsonia sp. 509MF]SEN25279.1 Glycosyl hydrolases family 43 [Leifsonia sp. 467MF]